MIYPSSAISPGGLLAEHFTGHSWRRWRAVLKAAEGERLTPAERVLFEEVAEREPPSASVTELWCIIGRSGGKDSVASAIATCAALGDYSKHLRAGEVATVLVLAVDRDQAKICHGYISAYFRAHPDLAPLIIRETVDTVELANRVEIIIATNSFRSIRGKTVVCAVMDEVSFWRDDQFANPDEQTYNALAPSLARIPGSRLIGISTSFKKSGLLIGNGSSIMASRLRTYWLLGARRGSSIQRSRKWLLTGR